MDIEDIKQQPQTNTNNCDIDNINKLMYIGIRRWHDMNSSIDHAGILANCFNKATLDSGKIFLIIASATLSTLGLLLNSPSVIIGSMLISPLMEPIIAIGFSFSILSTPLIIRAGYFLAIGIVVSIITSAMLVTISPVNDITSEIIARTRPNLFDLLIALFSGMVGVYSFVHANHTAIVGIAIATALMPPLSTVGFGIATMQPWITNGAAMLFITNIAAITIGTSLASLWYGFAPTVTNKIALWKTVLPIAMGIMLLTPLTDSLRDIASEVRIKRDTKRILHELVDLDQSNLMGDYHLDQQDDGTINLRGIIYVEQLNLQLGETIEQNLEESLERDVNVIIKQVRVSDLQKLKEKNAPPPSIVPPSAVANPIEPTISSMEIPTQ